MFVLFVIIAIEKLFCLKLITDLFKVGSLLNPDHIFAMTLIIEINKYTCV